VNGILDITGIVGIHRAMYQSGGTLMALWVGFCSLAGIALSVIVPALIARRVLA
jgi:hypothetical protein